jgi:hypothetical protein
MLCRGAGLAIGLDLHNLSIWNSNHVPFKSHDYFDDAQLHESLAEAMEEYPFDSINDVFPMEIPFQPGYKLQTIHSSLYERVNIHNDASQQTHLPGNRQTKLEQILLQYPNCSAES